MSYVWPMNTQVRETKNGWVDPKQWVVDNYYSYKLALPDLTEDKKCLSLA